MLSHPCKQVPNGPENFSLEGAGFEPSVPREVPTL